MLIAQISSAIDNLALFATWSLLVIFVLTAIVTLLAITRVIRMEARYTNKLFYSLLLETIAIVFAVVQGFVFIVPERIYTGYVELYPIDQIGRRYWEKDSTGVWRGVTIRVDFPTRFRNVPQVSVAKLRDIRTRDDVGAQLDPTPIPDRPEVKSIDRDGFYMTFTWDLTRGEWPAHAAAIYTVKP